MNRELSKSIILALVVMVVLSAVSCTRPIRRTAVGFAIRRPSDNCTFVKNQHISLEATGERSIRRYTWLSDLDGLLGEGKEIAIESSRLTEGEHTVTLVVETDSGFTDSREIVIRVLPQGSELPPNLHVVPPFVSFDARTDRTPVREVLIRNRGDGDLSWTAKATTPWMHLSSWEGVAPFDLLLTVDVSGLSPGAYEGTVAIHSSETVETQEVRVRLCHNPISDESIDGKCYPTRD